jgi:tRNA U34 5-carboxymethylaminomethyl modifying GTPase MnmE/TrmE
VEDLKEVAKKLRSLPHVDATAPTLALVGAPNVGKSSLVNVLSSGTPEVCNYPFTTRSIKMGHFYVSGRQHQVTDTPGLLARPEAARNRMERLTLAALEHLPTHVLFVADLTGGCGTTLPDQWAVRAELRARFPSKPWLDVFSKSDLLEDAFAAADALIAGGGGGGAVGGEAAVAGGEPATAAEFAARLPGALRVSSVTEDGILGLQEAVLRMLAAEQRRIAAAAAAGAGRRVAASGFGGGGGM